jgi:hypothetical protein
MKKLLPLTLLLVTCVASTVHAQNQSLRLARSVYEQGRLQEIPSILTGKLISTLTIEEKVEAYKLLCLTNIYLEEPEEADKYMLKILQTNHEFVLNRDADPAEFVALYETFRHEPVYRIGGTLGVNANKPNITGNASSVTANDGSSNYSALIGLQFGAVGELPIINHNFTLHGELLYTQKRFNLNIEVSRGADPFTGAQLTNSFTGIETQNWISLPVTVQYRIAKNKYSPFVTAGLAGEYLLSDQIVVSRLRDGFSPVQEKTFNLKSDRNAFNIGALIGTGVKIKLANGFLTGQILYTHGLTKINSEESVFANPELSFDFGYADPVYKLSSLSISFGYLINRYNPKKLSEKKKVSK